MKKFIDYLFPEVPEEATQPKHVPTPVAKPQPKVVKQEVKQEVPTSKRVEETQKVKEVSVQPREEVIANADRLSKSKSSFTIDIDKDFTKEPSLNKPQPKPAPEPKKYVSKPAISPIFGVLEDRKDPRIIDTPQYQADLNAKNASKIGTIFSPIYGIAQKQTPVTSLKEAVEEEPKQTVLEEVSANNGSQHVQLSLDLEQTSLMDMLDETSSSTETVDDVQDVNLQTFEEEPELNQTLKNMINDQDFTNGTIDDILIKPKDETHIISEQETISLFDDETEVE